MTPVQIVGAGGIGCAVGYALCAASVPVVLVEANPVKVEAGNRDGVQVDQYAPLAAEFVHFDDWKPSLGVPVLLCTKCYDNAAVLEKLPAGTELIPIQNGFDPQLHAFGHEGEGIASFVSECEKGRPHTRITRKGELHIGKRQASGGRKPPVLDLTGCLLHSLAKTKLFRVVEVPDIGPIKHSKLMYNAAISPLAAAAGIDNGKLLSIPEARQLFFALLQENHRILSAAGDRTRQGRAVPSANRRLDSAAEVARGVDGQVLRAVAPRNVLLDGRRNPERPHGDRQLQRPPHPARGRDRDAVSTQPGGIRLGDADDEPEGHTLLESAY